MSHSATYRRFRPKLRPYRYDKLSSPDNFRLLHLEHGQTNNRSRGRLQTYSVGDHSIPKYYCLSYRWKGKYDRAIYLDQGPFIITQHLGSFLESLYQEYGELTIWVDVICINQRDEREKSKQVARLSKIFQRAEGVFLWLGPEVPGSTSLITGLTNVYRFGNLSDEDQPEDYMRQIRKHPLALRALATNDYWGRAWIVQECVSAKRILVHWGSASIHWDLLILICLPALIRAASAKKEHLDHGFEPMRRVALARARLTPHQEYPARTFSSIDIYARDASRYQRFSFLDLLDDFEGVQCSVPVDRIYAFLPLATSLPPEHRRRQPGQSVGIDVVGNDPDRPIVEPDYTVTLRRAALRLLIAHGPENAKIAWGRLFVTLKDEMLRELYYQQALASKVKHRHASNRNDDSDEESDEEDDTESVERNDHNSQQWFVALHRAIARDLIEELQGRQNIGASSHTSLPKLFVLYITWIMAMLGLKRSKVHRQWT